MNGRFGAALVAFAVASATVAHGGVLPEFLVQLQDRNILGGALFQALLHGFGYAFVLALCGILAGGAVLLAAWRTRERGAPDIYVALAAILAALCVVPRAGVSLDPVGWLLAASFALTLERRGRGAAFNALAIAALWALVQGGATLAALLAIVALLGSALETRKFDATVRARAAIAACTIPLGALQLHALPWQAYGAHALYLDALLAGAQRDRLFTGGLNLPSMAFCAVVVCAAWYGVRRRDRVTDAIAFFALMLLTIADARNLPYFGIIGAPIVADAAASYYVHARSLPVGTKRGYAAAFLAASFAFAAIVTGTQPKLVGWPPAQQQPASLIAALARDPGPHRVLCQEPRWCDGASSVSANVAPLVDDRAGVTARSRRFAQADAEATRGPWRRELRSTRTDAVIASADNNLTVLLLSNGWRTEERDGSRLLLRPEAKR